MPTEPVKTTPHEEALREAYKAWEHSYVHTTESSYGHLKAAIEAYEQAKPKAEPLGELHLEDAYTDPHTDCPTHPIRVNGWSERIRVYGDRPFAERVFARLAHPAPAAPTEGGEDRELRSLASPSDEVLNIGLRALQDWSEPYVAPRESGVALDMDISQEDADYFNQLGRERLRPLWMAWAKHLSKATPSPAPSSSPAPTEKLVEALKAAEAILAKVAPLSASANTALFKVRAALSLTEQPVQKEGER